jgi:hypothetical protein
MTSTTMRVTFPAQQRHRLASAAIIAASRCGRPRGAMARGLKKRGAMKKNNPTKKSLNLTSQVVRSLQTTELAAAQGGELYSQKLPYYCTRKCPTWDC